MKRRERETRVCIDHSEGFKDSLSYNSVYNQANLNISSVEKPSGYHVSAHRDQWEGRDGDSFLCICVNVDMFEIGSSFRARQGQPDTLLSLTPG